MKTKLSIKTVLALLLSLILVIPSAYASSTPPPAEITPTYPGTNTKMVVGDVLYSNKSLYGSAAVVGHVGIVGSDYRIYHVTPVSDANGGGINDTIETYMGRHNAGEKIAVYRARYFDYTKAAKWAEQNYWRATEYSISVLDKLGTLDPNYCSKFIWQAFYFGGGVDVTGKNLGPNTYSLVYPLNFTYDQYFARITSFTATH